MKAFADIADLPEDERIKVIGQVAESGQIVGFVVEDDVKAARYEAKLLKANRVRIIDRRQGPIPNTVLVRVGPKES